jgi:hypothetical protein
MLGGAGQGPGDRRRTASLHTRERRGLTAVDTQGGQALLPSAAGDLASDCPVQCFQPGLGGAADLSIMADDSPCVYQSRTSTMSPEPNPWTSILVMPMAPCNALGGLRFPVS